MPTFLPYVWPNCAYRDMQPCEDIPRPSPKLTRLLRQASLSFCRWIGKAGHSNPFCFGKGKKGNDYSIYDPYKYGGDGPDKEVLLTTRYKYNGAKLEFEISAVLWFDSYSNTPPEPPKVTKVSLPAEKFVIYAIEDDLALRSEPSVTGYLWKRMLGGTELICLEEKSKVKSKLGVQGQWIQVQDPKGDQGYVAAWFVSEQKGKPAASTSTSVPVPAPKPVRRPSRPVAPAPATPKPAPVPPGAIALYPRPKNYPSVRSR